MRQYILIVTLLTGCALEAPTEGAQDLWDQGYDACIADISTDPPVDLLTELEKLRDDLDMCEFFRADEKEVWRNEITQCDSMIGNLYWKIDQLQKQGCSL